MAYHNPFIVKWKDQAPSQHQPGSSRRESGRRFVATSWPTGSWTFPPNETVRWSDFSAPCGGSLQQVTQPGDRVAILCPQNLDYLFYLLLSAPPTRPHCGAVVHLAEPGQCSVSVTRGASTTVPRRRS